MSTFEEILSNNGLPQEGEVVLGESESSGGTGGTFDSSKYALKNHTHKFKMPDNQTIRNAEILGGFIRNTEIDIKNTTGKNIFNVKRTGENVGDVTIGDYAGGSGALWDYSTGVFAVKGTITADLGIIAGWTIGATSLSSAGITLDSSVPKIESTNYVSEAFGSGFHIDEDLAEFGNIACRGLIRTSVFQKDVISTVGGNLMVLDGDVLDADMTASDASTLTTKATTTFSVGDFLRIKDGTDDEWLEVTAVNGAVYTVTRDKNSDYAADTNPAWKKGATVVNYGQSGDGGIFMTASESNAPYLSVFTHAGSPWTDLVTRLRLGNLNGSYGFGADAYGIGIGDSALSGHYFTFDHLSGNIALKGSLTITSGSGIANLSDTGDLALLNVVGNAYITDLAVSKLTAGSILSKAISLGITGGTGDCYISGGAGLDYANWTADKGFILGLDDSDSDKAKFFIGDHANNKYFSFDGTNADATGFRNIEVFTCGENITAGNIVCTKGSTYTTYPTDDSYVAETAPDTNYGSATYMYIGKQSSGGSKIWKGFIKFDLTFVPTNFLKAELRIKTLNTYGLTVNFGKLKIGRVVSADIDESTITYNNMPTGTTDSDSGYTDAIPLTDVVIGGGNDLLIDITQLVRQWKAGIYPNYGLVLNNTLNNAGNYIQIASVEHATEAHRPYLVITQDDASDGEIYKASNADYNLCRQIKGVATETISADSACKVQRTGKCSSVAVTQGNLAYLYTDGDFGTATTNLIRVVQVGEGTNTDEMYIDIDKSNLFIEKLPEAISLASGETVPLTSWVAIAPNDARYALIDFEITNTSYSKTYRHKTRIDRCGLSDQDQDTGFFGGSAIWENNDYGTGTAAASTGIDVDWSGDQITISKIGNYIDKLRFNIYFYR